jgi:hypothetical protein
MSKCQIRSEAPSDSVRWNRSAIGRMQLKATNHLENHVLQLYLESYAHFLYVCVNVVNSGLQHFAETSFQPL